MRVSLRDLFAKTTLYSPKDKYVIVSLGKDAQLDDLLPRLYAFSSITFEKDEISLVLTRSLWSRYSSRYKGVKVAGPYRLIAFDIAIDLDVCGYFAMISRLLAEANVSIIPVSTYLRDYILVRETDHRKAFMTINRFLRRQREAETGNRQ